jgi:hypothetical protein
MPGNAAAKLIVAAQTPKGAGGYGCPERPPLNRHHAERRGSREITRTEPSLYAVSLLTQHQRYGDQIWMICASDIQSQPCADDHFEDAAYCAFCARLTEACARLRHSATMAHTDLDVTDVHWFREEDHSALRSPGSG